ncbi:MAG TPA: lactate dehydrogenase [Methanoregulaceae archaeon]|nr:lactate dehydrogenase [Methanoregulaceae archaeon]
MTRLCVMGAGRIGGEVAFLASATGLVDELVLHDAVAPFLHAQVLDLLHTGLDITISTDLADASEADIGVFAAGSPRNPNIRSRADLLAANLPVADECIKAFRGFSGVLVAITNPSDANAYYISRKSGLDRSRVIGFGGQLDSARFALALRERGLGRVGTVLGEHGDHQVPIFSRAAPDVPELLREEILTGLRNASIPVMKGKGGTVFGPAVHIVALLRAVVEDRREVLPCAVALEGEYGIEGCSMAVPVEVGREGARRIEEWNLDPWESARMQEAGAFLGSLCAGLPL